MASRPPQRNFGRTPPFKGRSASKFKKKLKQPELDAAGNPKPAPPPEFIQLHEEENVRSKDVLSIADSYILNAHAETVCRAILNNDAPKELQTLLDRPADNKALFDSVALEHERTASMLFPDSHFVTPGKTKSPHQKSTNKWLEYLCADGKPSIGFLGTAKGQKERISREAEIIGTLIERNAPRRPGESETDVIVRARQAAKGTIPKVANGVITGESSFTQSLMIAAASWKKQETSRKQGGEGWKRDHENALENLALLTAHVGQSSTSIHLKTGIIQAYNMANSHFHDPKRKDELNKRAKKLQTGIMEPKLEQEALSLIPEETAASYKRLSQSDKRAFWKKTDELTSEPGPFSKERALQLMCLNTGVIAKDNRETAVRVADHRNIKGNTVLKEHDAKEAEMLEKQKAARKDKVQRAAQHAHGLIDETHGHVQKVAGSIHEGLQISPM